MAIAPITGTIKRKVLTDISVGLSIGFVFASYWWWGFHKNRVTVRENYYAKLAEKKSAEDA